jgi:hypothetical protein
MPINISIAAPLNIPPDVITGHVIAVQGGDVQINQPDIYMLASGSSITFEFTLSHDMVRQAKQMMITIPRTLSGPNLTEQASDVQTRIYNWQSQSWDTMSIRNGALPSIATSTYFDPDGRVLLQLTHPTNSGSTLYLGKPSLSLT